MGYTLGFKTNNFIDAALTLLIWIPLVRKNPNIATSIITLFKKLYRKLANYIRPEILNYTKSIAIAISTLVAALLLWGQSPYQGIPLTIFLSIALIVLSITAFSRYGEEPVRSFVNKNIIAKENRTSVAVAIGSAAIVIALIANSAGTINPLQLNLT